MKRTVLVLIVLVLCIPVIALAQQTGGLPALRADLEALQTNLENQINTLQNQINSIPAGPPGPAGQPGEQGPPGTCSLPNCPVGQVLVSTGPSQWTCGITCSGVYVDPLTNNSHCGGCDHACPQNTVCVDGTCACNGLGLGVCDGQCIDMSTDPGNCGECDNYCPIGQGCAEGRCIQASIEWCSIHPVTLTDVQGFISAPVYGTVYAPGLTERPGRNSSIIGEYGIGPATNPPNPQSPDWGWVMVEYSSQVNNSDEYFNRWGTFNARAGIYNYTYRFSINGGDWTYCEPFGTLTVVP